MELYRYGNVAGWYLDSLNHTSSSTTFRISERLLPLSEPLSFILQRSSSDRDTIEDNHNTEYDDSIKKMLEKLAEHEISF